MPAVNNKTKSDWKFIRGQVSYVDLVNNWISFKFANVEDMEMVWRERHWHVNGLNLLLSSWLSFFNPYSTCIDWVDQWVRVPRLPWEFWDHDTLVNLLKLVGNVIKVDQTILLPLKGKFVRVCVNIDVT